MEVRIKHPVVEGGQEHRDPTWKFDPNQPNITEAPTIVNAGNELGFADIETDDWDFDEKPVEFHDEQPTKAATKWVNEYKNKNPDMAKPAWPTKEPTTKK